MAPLDQMRRSRLCRDMRLFVTSRPGTIAVEFGMIAPVILTMFLGVVEIGAAISTSLSVQAAARAATHFGLTTPPVQGDLSPILGAARAAMPADWTAADTTDSAQVNASLVCECELTGAVACGAACAAGEKSLTYLKVDVSKVYTPIVKLRYFTSGYAFKSSSQVRLQ